MAGDTKDDEKLRDSEIAIVDALKMLMEVLVATGTVRAEVFQKAFAHQRDGYIAKEMPNAAVIMEVLRGFAVPAAREAEPVRPELAKPPAGTA